MVDVIEVIEVIGRGRGNEKVEGVREGLVRVLVRVVEGRIGTEREKRNARGRGTVNVNERGRELEVARGEEMITLVVAGGIGTVEMIVVRRGKRMTRVGQRGGVGRRGTTMIEEARRDGRMKMVEMNVETKTRGDESKLESQNENL